MTDSNRSIHANIHPSVLDRVPKMFNGGLSDILTETFQNARRAGATSVRVDVEAVALPDNHRHIITITDDGNGISDPALLLSYGKNGWDTDTIHREDAAGMGFLSLARHGCSVSSRPASSSDNPMPGWTVDLHPDHFTAKRDATVIAFESAPFPNGTSLRFEIDIHPTDIRKAVAKAAKYYPLPVTMDGFPDSPNGGQIQPRSPFIDGAYYTETWQGIEFGVFINRGPDWFEPIFNFHGLTIEHALPIIYGIDNSYWSVRANIQDCPKLQLVLPSRREIVKTPFIDKLHEAARMAIYRAMEQHPDPQPTFADWTAALEQGILLSSPPVLLRPWQPTVADCFNDLLDNHRTFIPHDAIVIAQDLEPQIAQAFSRAAHRSDLHHRLFEAHSGLTGFPWYDLIPHLAAIDVTITHQGIAQPIENLAPPAQAPHNRPDEIELRLTIENQDGPATELVIPTDVAFAGEAYCYIADIRTLVTASSDIQPGDLADLIERAYFCYSEDSDTWESQQDQFARDATRIAMSMLCTKDEATIAAIHDAVQREIRWLCPNDRTVSITITQGTAEILLLPHKQTP